MVCRPLCMLKNLLITDSKSLLVLPKIQPGPTDSFRSAQPGVDFGCVRRWCNKLKMNPLRVFAPSRLLRVRSWLHPFEGHFVNKKQCETRGLFMSLVIHYWIGDVQDSQGVSILQNVIFFNNLPVINLLINPTKKAQYSLIVLKVPLNPSQWIRSFSLLCGQV